MTEQDNTDPRKPGEGATADSGWQGDAADQGNDLRFGEEQQLIEEQSKANAPEGEHDKADASHGYTSHQDRHDAGEYTDRDQPKTESENDDAHGYTSHQDRDHPGGYTDSDEES